ncbi:hypothetical protein DID88_005423 [Monilinia fructigena]|uniref:Uncharacterized protein n=1 Tax=Monilinia fructigena TaxID=38457 RepID=A0A395IZQ8_9HELO|nr:hypothetical protein DID88_005423 [Monilinia fructigena]
MLPVTGFLAQILMKNNMTLLPTSYIPESYTFEDLYRELAKEREEVKDEELESILILASYLKESNRLKGTDDDDDGGAREA